MRFGRMFFAIALVAGMSGLAEAGPFGLFNRKPVRNVAITANAVAHGAVNGAAGGIAQAKAQIQANSGVMRHVGGSLGAGRYEGVGFSSVSANDAIRRCCYWGSRTPLEIGVARGHGGWLATVLYR